MAADHRRRDRRGACRPDVGAGAGPDRVLRDFRVQHPDGKVLNRQTGFTRSYGRNPYAGYDYVSSSPFLFRGETDKRLSALERVVTITRGRDHLAVPFPALRSPRASSPRASAATPVVILWAPGTASALDATVIADARDVGAAGVFD
ncbi:MAG: DUF3179 domain-containing protein, partial [Armatimonadetes bacterium]|nr:DUF3179 domain-containing protein [Armatimonadota bacterium]